MTIRWLGQWRWRSGTASTARFEVKPSLAQHPQQQHIQQQQQQRRAAPTASQEATAKPADGVPCLSGNASHLRPATPPASAPTTSPAARIAESDGFHDWHPVGHSISRPGIPRHRGVRAARGPRKVAPGQRAQRRRRPRVRLNVQRGALHGRRRLADRPETAPRRGEGRALTCPMAVCQAAFGGAGVLKPIATLGLRKLKVLTVGHR